MTMSKTLAIVILASAGLAACGTGGSKTQLFSQFGLYFNQDDQSASLAYGKPNSDEVGLMLQCAKGSRQVDITDVARSVGAERLVLTSGRQRLDIPVKVSMDESGAPLANTRLPIDAPVLQGFRSSGSMDVRLGSLRYGMSAEHGSASPVAMFFDACENS
jgi:hypothetical protein